MSLIRPHTRVRAEDFSRGFLDSPETDTLHPGATPEARNAMLARIEIGETSRATLAKRRGSRLLNPVAMSVGDPVDGLHEFRREDAAPVLLAACDGVWYAFNDVDTFTAVSGATGYDAGATARITTFKNQAWLYDGGPVHQLYDGTTVRVVGIAKPTGVTNMTATGTGVTGTFTARYTWYDQLHDHESSPTEAATASLATTNQSRVHTKPAGSPPAHVTHWRAYVRREDTSEVYWMRVATVAIGTSSHTEAVIDAARRDLMPRDSDNDPPTFAPAIAGTWKGYGLAFEADDSTLWISQRGDIESWPPRNQFPINPGDSEPVRLSKAYGTRWLLMKPHATYQLLGTELPFDIEPVHSAFGSVSQEAGLEVLGRFFAWDAIKGPYWTDLSSWVPLADFTIEHTLAHVNRAALTGIRAVHDEQRSLIIWAVPTTGSPRRRTLLAYHYGLGCWLPPMTGLEYASLAQYTDDDGQLGVFTGDYWGRVYQLFDADREGPPAGTLTGTITNATTSSLTDSTAAFYTTSDGLVGMPVMVQGPDGSRQWRRILSNTGTAITIDTTAGTPWSVTPAAGWRYAVGGIDWFWRTPWLDFGQPGMAKRLGWLSLQMKPLGGDSTVEIRARFNERDASVDDRPVSFHAGAAGGVWGSGQWGAMLWGGTVRRFRKLRLFRACFSAALEFANPWPDQPVEITRYEIDADLLPRRRVGGAER